MSSYRFLFLSLFSLILLPGILLASPSRDRADALFEDAVALNKQRQFKDAIISFVRAVKLVPGDHKYHRGLHMTYQATGRIRQGINFYRNLVREVPENAVAHYWLGRYYLSNRSLEDAAIAFEESARLDPKDEHPFISLGHVYSRLGKNKESLKAFLQADKMVPGVAVVKVGLGNSYFRMKEFDKARKEYEEAVAEDPSFTEAQFNLGILYERSKDYDKAYDQWQLLIEADPNDSAARENLAKLYYRGGFYLDALREYSTLSLVKVDTARIFLGLGESQIMLASELNDEKDRDLLKLRAIESFKRTLEIDPKNDTARQYLERLEALELKKRNSKKK
ncbi:MAG: tetratricopeptide repeat protein [Nitrospiria bacterium]